MTQEKLTPAYLCNVIQRTINQVTDAGFTKAQLCQEAGIMRQSLSKIKNPRLSTIVKLIEAKDSLLKKKNNS